MHTFRRLSIAFSLSRGPRGRTVPRFACTDYGVQNVTNTTTERRKSIPYVRFFRGIACRPPRRSGVPGVPAFPADCRQCHGSVTIYGVALRSPRVRAGIPYVAHASEREDQRPGPSRYGNDPDGSHAHCELNSGVAHTRDHGPAGTRDDTASRRIARPTVPALSAGSVPACECSNV